VQILEIIEKITGMHLDNIQEDEDLLASNFLDSFAFVELIMELQRLHGIEVPADIMDSEQLRTIRGLEGLINDK
jgi:acyl carrier protein